MTRHQFYAKHQASMRSIMDAISAATTAMADMRTCAERAAKAASSTPELVATARELDTCCACLVRLVSKLPVEIITSLYSKGDQQVAQAPTTYPERPE
jgi:hypothetical protein